MIKSNELRIGNLLIDKRDMLEKEVVVINCDDTIRIRFNNQIYGCFFLNNFEPIPLTEEWLLKCGFYYTDDDNVFLALPVFKNFELNSDKSNDFSTVSFRINNNLKEIEYVNQLQNLYFSLTGEELIYNQDVQRKRM